jgi:TolB-like protein/tetratricopeptide (TPR) repeat protein
MTMAVLPFDVLDGDPETQRLAGALSLAVTQQLIRSGLTVLQADGLDVDSGKPDNMTSLNVRYLIKGSVANDGDFARVVIHLDHARRGVTIWSTTLDAPLSDTGRVADRLAAHVARTVSWGGAADTLNSDDPRSAEIASLFLLAIQLSDEGDDIGALKAFERLAPLTRDGQPGGFAIESMDALPALAPQDRKSVLQAARKAVEKGKQLYPDWDRVPEAVVLPAYAWSERIAGYNNAVERTRSENRGGSGPTRFLAQAYLRVGESAIALDTIERFPANDPYGKSKLYVHAEALVSTGKAKEADAALADAALIWPVNPIFPTLRFDNALWQGDLAEAAALLHGERRTHVAALEQRLALLEKIIAARHSNRGVDIDAVARDCSALKSSTDYVSLEYCFSAMAVFNRSDDAFAIAAVLFPDIRPKAGEDPDAAWLAAPPVSWEPLPLFMPWTANLRADPRIVPVFERLGLLNHWRTTGDWPDFCEREPLSVCSKMRMR